MVSCQSDYSAEVRTVDKLAKEYEEEKQRHGGQIKGSYHSDNSIEVKTVKTLQKYLNTTLQNVK